MSQTNENYFESLPVGRLGIIPLESCKALGRKVDDYLVKWRRDREHSRQDSLILDGYERDTYCLLYTSQLSPVQYTGLHCRLFL